MLINIKDKLKMSGNNSLTDSTYDLNSLSSSIEKRDVIFTDGENKKIDKGFKDRITELFNGEKKFSELSTKDQMFVAGAAGTVVSLALPLLPLAVAGMTLALATFFTFKALNYVVIGVNKLAEKTVKGAEIVAENTVAGAKSLGSTMVDSTKHAAGKAAEGIKQITKKRKGSYDTKSTDSQSFTENFDHIRELFQETFKNPSKNGVIENILSEIELSIASKIEDLKKTIDYSNREESRAIESSISKLESQRDYISKLNPKILQKELSDEKINPKLYVILSTYNNEITEMISRSKLRSGVLDNLNTAAKENGTRKRSPSLTSLESGYGTDNRKSTWYITTEVLTTENSPVTSPLVSTDTQTSRTSCDVPRKASIVSVHSGATDAQSTTSRNNDDVSRRTSIGSVYFDATDAQPTTPEDNSKGAAPKGNILQRACSAVKGVTEKLSPRTKLNNVSKVTSPEPIRSF